VTLMMEGILSSETSILTRVTRPNIQEDGILHISPPWEPHILQNYVNLKVQYPHRNSNSGLLACSIVPQLSTLPWPFHTSNKTKLRSGVNCNRLASVCLNWHLICIMKYARKPTITVGLITRCKLRAGSFPECRLWFLSLHKCQ
jgi:hypothetical protein